MTLVKKAYSGRLVFDHLPKTAGQAINAWMVSELGTGCVTPNLIGEHSCLIRDYGGAYSVISAHVRFSDGEPLDPRYQYITLLRDPVDRVISWLYFVINNHDDIQLPFLRKAAIDFLDGGSLMNERISNIYVEHFCRIEGSGEESDEKKLANAFAAIKKYDVVGIYDDIHGFISETAALIGVPPPTKLNGVNVTRQRPQVSEIPHKLRLRIAELNLLDIRLFEMVVAWKKSASLGELQKKTEVSIYQFEKYDRWHHRNTSSIDLRISSAILREGGEFQSGQLMTFDIDISLNRDMNNFEIGIHFFNAAGKKVFETNSQALGYSYPSMSSGYYRVTHHVIADLPVGKYTAGLSFSERVPEGVKDIFWQDVLYGFDVVHPKDSEFSGYSYLPVSFNISKTKSALIPVIVSKYTGWLRVVHPIKNLKADDIIDIDVEVMNSTDCLWIGDNYLPVSFSYHWFRADGEVEFFDGLRSPIPSGGLKPGVLHAGKIKVQVPRKPGSYTLVLTLIQESVNWFEEKGFEAARCNVEIGASNE